MGPSRGQLPWPTFRNRPPSRNKRTQIRFSASPCSSSLASSWSFSASLGGYVLSHGKLGALWQPYELVIIGGAALGAFLVSTPVKIVKETLQRHRWACSRAQATRQQDYIDLLSPAVRHVQQGAPGRLHGAGVPRRGPGQQRHLRHYPKVLAEHHLIDFITDCLRLMVGGSMDPHELEPLLELRAGDAPPRGAGARRTPCTKMADAPAGLRHRGRGAGHRHHHGLASTATPSGSASTSLAPWSAPSSASCCPTASSARWPRRWRRASNDDSRAFECVKVALLANLRGYNPMVAVEFARKSLLSDSRPSFLRPRSAPQGGQVRPRMAENKPIIIVRKKKVRPAAITAAPGRWPMPTS